MIADGIPRFTPGEELVLFLQKLPVSTPVFQVVGLEEGRMIVVRDGANGAGRLYRDLSGSMRVVRALDGRLEPAPLEDALGGITIDELASRLASMPVGIRN